MSRRHRRMIYSSSSDDDDDNHRQSPPHQLQHHDTPMLFEDAISEQHDEDIEIPSDDLIPNITTVTLDSTPTTAAAAAAAINISDDDFIDVADNLSTPSSPSPPPPMPQPSSIVEATPFVASDCPVNDQLRKMGLYLKREWLDSCQLGLRNSVSGFGNLDVEGKAKLCFGQFLYSDMNVVGAGVLPENVCGLHLVDLAGPFVLQVDEVVNISCPLRERYKNAAPGLKRCLKLSMTDGVQRVFGMEYRPIKNLAALSPAGFKVVIRNVNVRRGLLMLVPEVFEILGGSVEELEAARQRVVQEVNKPPRGKRTRTGTVPPLSSRATQAAWPQNGVTDHSVPHNVANPVVRNSTNSAIHSSIPSQGDFQGGGTLSRTTQASRADRQYTELSGIRGTNEHSINRASGHEPTRSESDQHINIETGQQSISREAAQGPISRETSSHSSVAEAHGFPVRSEVAEPQPSVESVVLNPLVTSVVENEDASMVDYHTEYPFMLSGEKEFPFTYMATLLSKWGAVQDKEPSVQGKVKCFVTGVTGFQYRDRSTFELLVFIDDGSLINRVFIHHNVVQNKLGYSPHEVTAAITSSDLETVESMKKTLLQFQIFLSAFEGTMLLEINKTSDYPVALEMAQSCLDIDAWQLLHRVKPPTSSPTPQNGNSTVISLSP
ncbi:hypothetical protein RND81_02G048600 [Saponaria officinalis]|uniref:RecQ-mediated genome instability protein 1 n=1 Tax=Saponaria officinalis TaxID=3572 RepID=A0AAW1MR26_SAPOF